MGTGTGGMIRRGREVGLSEPEFAVRDDFVIFRRRAPGKFPPVPRHPTNHRESCRGSHRGSCPVSFRLLGELRARAIRRSVASGSILNWRKNRRDAWVKKRAPNLLSTSNKR